MTKDKTYFLVSKEAASEVHQKVIRIKARLIAEPQLSVNHACKDEGLSRSTYYKYRNDVHAYLRDEQLNKNYFFSFRVHYNSIFLEQFSHLVDKYKVEIIQMSQYYLGQGESNVNFNLKFSQLGVDQEFYHELESIRTVRDLSYQEV